MGFTVSIIMVIISIIASVVLGHNMIKELWNENSVNLILCLKFIISAALVGVFAACARFTAEASDIDYGIIDVGCDELEYSKFDKDE
jgi:hypothetical protein